MSQLMLKSKSQYPIKELIIDALAAERKELLTAFLKTKECLAKFESKYHVSTSKFINNTARTRNMDNMEAVEWEGEYEILQRIKEKLNALKEIKVCA